MSAVSQAVIALAMTVCCMVSESSLAETPGTQLIRPSKAGIAVVRGSSMLPFLQDGDRVKVLSISVDTPISRGQLVLVSFAGREHRMVKRLFAVPGDTLSIRDGGMQLNGRVVSPQGWPQSYRVSNKSAVALRAQLNRHKERIPKNQYVIFGDNPLNSQDSLDYGFVSRAQITATIKPVLKAK